MTSTANTTTPPGEVMPIYVASSSSGSEQHGHQPILPAAHHNEGDPALNEQQPASSASIQHHPLSVMSPSDLGSAANQITSGPVAPLTTNSHHIINNYVQSLVEQHLTNILGPLDASASHQQQQPTIASAPPSSLPLPPPPPLPVVFPGMPQAQPQSSTTLLSSVPVISSRSQSQNGTPNSGNFFQVPTTTTNLSANSLPPIPSNIIQQIRDGKFVNFDHLLPDNLGMPTSAQISLNFDGETLGLAPNTYGNNNFLQARRSKIRDFALGPWHGPIFFKPP